jgi:predicted dehydrogenase
MVGLGAGGGFASAAQLPALRAVHGYEIVGVAASAPESVRSADERHRAVPCEWPLGRGPDKSRLLAHEAAERDISSTVADLSPLGLVTGLPGQHPGVDR